MFCAYIVHLFVQMKKHGIEVWSYFVDENVVWNNQVRTCAYTFILVDIYQSLFDFFLLMLNISSWLY